MTRQVSGVLLCLTALALIVGAAIVSYLVISEAYGSGPPYYGRTQNMDKWSDPIPLLVTVDGVCLSAAMLLARAGRRKLL